MPTNPHVIVVGSAHPGMEGPVKCLERLSSLFVWDFLAHDFWAAPESSARVKRLLIRLIFAGRNRMT